MLDDELMQGTIKFIVQQDGTETIEVRPPTARELRAGRQLKRLKEELNNVMVAYNQLQLNHQALATSHDELVKAFETQNAKTTSKEAQHVDTGNSTHQADPV